MEFTLTRETVEAAQRRLDAQIAGACTRAGRLDLIEQMVSSVLTLEQVEAQLRQPAAQPPYGGHRAPAPYSPSPFGGQPASGFEGFAAEAFGRMRAAAPAPAAQHRPSPANDRAAFAGAAWPQGRPG